MGPVPEDVWGVVVRDTFPDRLSDADALLLFNILHLYAIEPAVPLPPDTPWLVDGRFEGDTQRGCGATLAGLWAGADDWRANPVNWYYEWNVRMNYSGASRLTPEQRARTRELIRQIEQHPLVARLVPEDFDPAAETG